MRYRYLALGVFGFLLSICISVSEVLLLFGWLHFCVNVIEWSSAGGESSRLGVIWRSTTFYFVMDSDGDLEILTVVNDSDIELPRQ